MRGATMARTAGLAASVKSARPYLWPFIVVNVVSFAAIENATTTESVCLSGALCLLASFGFLINDLWDRDVDRLNGVGRLADATPSTLRFVAVVACGTLTAALALLAVLGALAVGLGFLIAGGLTVYTVLVRSIVPLATLLAAALSASPIWMPIALWGYPQAPLSALALVSGSYVLLVGREIFLDVKDRTGDEAAGRKTLATLVGARRGSLLGALIAMFGVLLLAGAIAPLGDPRAWLVVAIIGASTLLPASFVVLARRPETEATMVARWSKVGMAMVPVLVLLSSRGA